MKNEIPYQLFSRYFSGLASDSEKSKIENWRKKTKENEKYFQQAKKIWDNAGKTQFKPKPDVEKALRSVHQQIDITDSISKAGKKASKRKITHYLLRVAAVLLLLVGMFFIYQNIKDLRNMEMQTEISADNKTELILADGTHIWLNKFSKLDYPENFSDTIRKVYLSGEAYFEVSENPEKPFVIETENSLTRVLGTAFNLRANPAEKQEILVLTEGKVLFAGKKSKQQKKLKVKAGEKVILKKENEEIVKKAIDNKNYMAWKTGRLEFRNQKLSSVVATLSDYYETKIEIGDSALKQQTLTATYKNNSLDEVLEVLKISLSLKVLKKERKIVLQRTSDN